MSTAPHQRRLAVGIDLGTTNSLVATVRNSIPEVLSDEEGRALLPSIVRYLPNRYAEIGYKAQAAQTVDPRNTIVSVKRFMGRGLKDIAYAENLPAGQRIGTLVGASSTWVWQGWRDVAVYIFGTGRGKTSSLVVRHMLEAVGAAVMLIGLFKPGKALLAHQALAVAVDHRLGADVFQVAHQVFYRGILQHQGFFLHFFQRKRRLVYGFAQVFH